MRIASGLLTVDDYQSALVDEFFATLPGESHEALGDRIGDLRPRWAIGTSRLVARMLSKHIDEFADRDLSLVMGR